MTDLELIFSMLGAASTVEITRSSDAKGFKKNQKVAQEGGKIEGNARVELEKKTGRKVTSNANYLGLLKESKI